MNSYITIQQTAAAVVVLQCNADVHVYATTPVPVVIEVAGLVPSTFVSIDSNAMVDGGNIY